MFFRITVSLILSLMLLPAKIGLSAQAIDLTLDEAVAIALRDNRNILLKRDDIEKAKQKIAEAKAGLMPTLTFTVNRTNTRDYYSKNRSETQTQTTLKQYLYKGGETVNTISQNKFKLDVSKSLLDKARLEVGLSVNKAFYTLLLAYEFVSLNKSIVNNTEKHLNFIRERYKNGEASESDILNIEASLKNVQHAYEESLSQLESAQALLNNLLCLDYDAKIKPRAEFSYEKEEIAYEEAYLLAMSQRPEIKQYEFQEKADEKAVEIAKADSRPSVYASWDYYSRSTTSLTFSPSKGWQDYNIIGFTFSWPVFDGWATRAKVEQAILDLKETQLTKEKTISDIALELKNSYLSLKNSIEKIKATESDLVVYKDNQRNIDEKYTKGIVSLLGKEDARLKYEIALFNQKQSIYDYILAKSSFDKATGGFDVEKEI